MAAAIKASRKRSQLRNILQHGQFFNRDEGKQAFQAKEGGQFDFKTSKLVGGA